MKHRFSAVAIAGMHRSGTSLIARALNLAGLYLGPDADISAAGPDNPEGFWENTRFVRINETLLSVLGAGWDRPPVLTPGWPDQAGLLPQRALAAELITEFAGHEPWGWKDPRNSITLEFWRTLLPDLKVVICLRNPLEVAQSLSRRGYSSTAFGLDLWLTYNEQLLSAVPADHRIITHYDSYFQDPAAEVARLLAFLDLKPASAQVKAAVSAVSLPLRHNRANLLSLLASRPSFEVVDLYQKMCIEAGPVYKAAAAGDPAAPSLSRASYERLTKELEREALKTDVSDRERTIQDLHEQILSQARELETLPALHEQLLAQSRDLESLQQQLAASLQANAGLAGRGADLEQNLAALNTQLVERQVAIDDLNSRLAEADRSIAAGIAESDRRIGELTARLAESDRQLKQVRPKLASAEHAVDLVRQELAQTRQRAQLLNDQLWEVTSSAVWSLGLRLRAIRLVLAPPGTLRDRMFRTGLNALRLWRREGFRAMLRRVWRKFAGGRYPVTSAPPPFASPSVEQPLPSTSSWRSDISPPSGYDVLNFPIIEWGYRFQRPQQLARRFAQDGHRVFYLSTVFHAGTAPVVRPVEPGVYEVSLAGPAGTHIYSQSLDGALLDSLEAAIVSLSRACGIISAVCKVDLPFWGPLALRLRDRFGWKVVYDCMDLHRGFGDTTDAMLLQEDALVDQSDLVLASSHPLHSALSDRSANCLLVPNAADVEHFRSAPADVPAALRGLRHPVIGYYGAIAEWFDASLVRELALAQPDWSFVLIGHKVGADLAPLNGLKNVHQLEEQPYASLPGFLHAFDVCMIPFKKTPLTDATNPVKLFEFLSAGKPVVATDLTELGHYRDHARLASSPEQWLQALTEALRDTSPERTSERLQFALHNTWDQRYELINGAVASLYPAASIVVVTFNGLEHTQRCLDSLYKWSGHPDFEVIVVDNASSDGTPEYLKRLASTHANLQLVLNSTNEGFARANNQGIARARGEHVVLLNNDTVVSPGWLPRLLRYLDDPEVGLVGPLTNRVWNEARIEPSVERPDDVPPFAAQLAADRAHTLTPVEMLAMYCTAGRKEVFDQLGPLDEQFGLGMFEDNDYALRARQAGFRVGVAEDVFIFHAGQAGFNQLGEKKYLELFEANRAKLEAKWNLEWTAHPIGTIEKNRRFASELYHILASHPAVPGVAIFPPTIGWGITLIQRPHQLARALARRGWLVFFCVDDEVDRLDGFREVESNLFLARIPWAVFDLIKAPVVFTLPYNRKYLTHFRSPRIVYEVIDDLAVFPGDQAALRRNHAVLLKEAEVVVVTADRLLQDVHALRPDALLCPNGVEFEHFAGAAVRGSGKPPMDLAELVKRRRPVIGYYGALARWFDYELVEHLAQARPQWDIVLIGQELDDSLRSSKLLARPNVHWLQSRDYHVLPDYLRWFDVATIPFLVNEITLATSPIKLFEYMAAAKPIVTTDLTECRNYPGVLIGHDPAEFVTQVDRALTLRGDAAYTSQLQATAAANTWDRRVDAILGRLAPASTQGRQDTPRTDASKWPPLGEAGPLFREAVLRHHEPNKPYEMYPVWLQYSLESNRRGMDVFHRLSVLGALHGHRHLDVGCAYGGTCIAFARSGMESVGIDIAPGLLRLAGANLADHPGLNVRLLRRDVGDWDAVSDLGEFDIITCDNVIEHVLDVQQVLLNIARLLTPSGVCHMAIPNGRSVAEITRDGHFGKFGITLLPRGQAEAYYLAAGFPGKYDVGQFHTIDQYKRSFAAAGMSLEVVNGLQPDHSAIEALGREVNGLRDLYKKERAAGSIPSASADAVGAELDGHFAAFGAEYQRYKTADSASQPKLGARLVRDYQEGLWFVTARKLT